MAEFDNYGPCGSVSWSDEQSQAIRRRIAALEAENKRLRGLHALTITRAVDAAIALYFETRPYPSLDANGYGLRRVVNTAIVGALSDD